jgi:hypothetical protein
LPLPATVIGIKPKAPIQGPKVFWSAIDTSSRHPTINCFSNFLFNLDVSTLTDLNKFLAQLFEILHVVQDDTGAILIRLGLYDFLSIQRVVAKLFTHCARCHPERSEGSYPLNQHYETKDLTH